MSVSTSSRVSGSGSTWYSRSNSAAVMIRLGFFGTGGVFTPRLGWIVMTSSANAVVKIALRIDTLQYWIVRGRAPFACIAETHWRTCSGMMSRIFIGPKNGSRCLRICLSYSLRTPGPNW